MWLNAALDITQAIQIILSQNETKLVTVHYVISCDLGVVHHFHHLHERTDRMLGGGGRGGGRTRRTLFPNNRK